MIRTFKNSAFSDAQSIKRFDGDSWNDASTAKRFDGGIWIDLLDAPAPNEYERTYNLQSSAVYWNNGSRDSQSATGDSLIHGTWNGSLSSSRRSLLIFDSAMLDDIDGAEIVRAELYLMRESSTHGNAGNANVRIKAHSCKSLPAKWTGADEGSACSVQLLKRGQGGWFALGSSIVNALGRSVFGIALDADSAVSMSDYCRFVRTGANAPKLRITYMR